MADEEVGWAMLEKPEVDGSEFRMALPEVSRESELGRDARRLMRWLTDRNESDEMREAKETKLGKKSIWLSTQRLRENR